MLPARYPAPAAQDIFSDAAKFNHWKTITDAYAIEGIEACLESYASDPVKDDLISRLNATNAPTPEMVAEFEAEHGHDVVAFLAAYCVKVGRDLGPFIHYGLTSSDLVDYGLFQMLANHSGTMAARLHVLVDTMRQPRETQGIRPGRTHGQIAGHTTWGHQIAVSRWALIELRESIADSVDYLPVVKSPGPTGWPDANPEVYERGRQVANRLNCEFLDGTQVVHRDRLLEWACLYVRLAGVLENLALLVRAGARAEIAEVREGAARTGSSSMPHKRNPIDSEKVCGLARVARGCFSTIAENVALWDDRDISNSSVERIVVPELAATLEYMTTTMTRIMSDLVLDPQQMEGHAHNPACVTDIYQMAIQKVCHKDPIEASTLVTEAIRDYWRYPGMWRTSIQDHLMANGLDGVGWREEIRERICARFES